MCRKLGDKAIQYVIIASCVSFIVVVCLMVLDRYLFHLGWAWVMEGAAGFYMWASFIGAAAAFKEGRHVSIGVITDRVSPSISRKILIFDDFLILCFCLTIVVLGVIVVTKVTSYGVVTTYLEVPYGYLYVSVPLGFGIMSIMGLAALIRKWRAK